MDSSPNPTPIADVEEAYEVCTSNRLAKFMSVWSALRDGLITSEDLFKHLNRVYFTVMFEVERYWILCLLQFVANYSPEMKTVLQKNEQYLKDMEVSASERLKLKIAEIHPTSISNVNTGNLCGSWIPNKYENGELTELFYYSLSKVSAKLSSHAFRQKGEKLRSSKDLKEIEIHLKELERCEEIAIYICENYDPSLPDKKDKYFLPRKTHSDLLKIYEEQRTELRDSFRNAIKQVQEIKRDLESSCSGSCSSPVHSDSINPNAVSDSQKSAPNTTRDSGKTGSASNNRKWICLVCGREFDNDTNYDDHSKTSEHKNSVMTYRSRFALNSGTFSTGNFF